MENNTPTKTEKTPEQIAAAWSKMGLAIRETDMRLQAMAQAAIAKIKIPQTVSDIIEAEKLVIELRADFKAIQEERKKVSSILDGAITKLSKSEKLIYEKTKDGETGAIKPLLDAVFTLKKQAEIEQNKIKWHNDEVKQIKEQIANHITNFDATCKQKIVELVDKAYSFALGNGDIKAEEVENYISRLMKSDKTSEKEFKISDPAFQFKYTYTTTDERKELWENAIFGLKEPMIYRQDLHDALTAKFEFYDIAVKNKAESLKLAAQEREAAEAAIKKEVSEAETANKLTSISNVHDATPIATHKELKKVYTIDMIGENWNDATMVMTAFVANLEKCKEEIRVKNIWNLSIAQMAVALQNIKNKDNAFEFGSLKFKLTDKL